MLSDAELTVKFAEATHVAIRNHLFELLWKRHEAFVRESVQAMGSLTPLGYDTHTFLDDVERRVRVKVLLGGLKIYEGRGPFPHFLWKVVKTCALDWRRRITRRSRRETVAARLGGKQTDDTGTPTLERLAFRSGFYCGDPSHLLVHRDRQAADQVVHEEMPPDSAVPKPRVCVNEPLLRIAPDRHSLREGRLTCWSQDTAPSLQWLMRPEVERGLVPCRQVVPRFWQTYLGIHQRRFRLAVESSGVLRDERPLQSLRLEPV